jgi:hypothetical protein
MHAFEVLAYFCSRDNLQFHPFHYKPHNFILLYNWIELNSVCIQHLRYPFFRWWHLGWVHNLAIVNCAVINVSGQVSTTSW